jgi:hypothetical protein
MNKHGLYSKAAQIIRSLPQEKGTAEQMIGAAKKLGIKQVEIDNAKPPTGPITREALAKHFENNLPNMSISQYGENPSFTNREFGKRFMDLQMRSFKSDNPLSPEERSELDRMFRINNASPNVITEPSDDEDGGEPSDPIYSNYTIPGGKNYRERLLSLNTEKGKPRYNSSHWTDHDNVLAHIRMSDRTVGEDRDAVRPIAEKLSQGLGIGIRDLASGATSVGLQRGVITPEEAASLSRVMGWRNGYDQGRGIGKRLLHVEELQSDWGQEGREKGFSDPNNQYEIFNTKSGDVVSRHPSYEAMWDAFRAIPEDQAAGLDYGKATKSPPAAPYVQNTQHWTDLALKNVLREAALGNYEGVVFSPGQAQADRYGLEKKLSRIDLRRPEPGKIEGSRLFMYGLDGRQTGEGVNVEDEGHLNRLVGQDVAGRLLASPATEGYGSEVTHSVKGDDLKMGGEGMKGYYDNIVPKSVMRLAQQHDPAAKPGEPVQIGDYQGFHLPMTDTLKSSILDKGFSAFKRGGRVGFAQGGLAGDDESGISNNQNGEEIVKTNAPAAPVGPAPRPQAGELPFGGGVRRGSGLLQAQDEAPLEGLPTEVSIPMTGQVIQAGPDPRVRAVARDYMASTGMPYNPPTKYAKVDPSRSERISDAYESMTDDASDPLTKASYEAMIKETMAQYQAAKAAGFKAEFWNPETDEDPYHASPRLATEDIRKNHHMWVYPTDAGYGSDGPITEEQIRKNPMLRQSGETWNGVPVTVNDIFRAVHDYFGHAKEGVGFRDNGEENAWRAHASMFSPLARLAMTSETRGQNSWLNYGPFGDKNRKARTEDSTFAPQKIGILPHWVHHEGAEDFMTDQDVADMQRHRMRHGRDVSQALALTRRFTKR